MLADDLIWSTRLAAMIDGLAGRTAIRMRTLPDLVARIGPDAEPAVGYVIVDLTARAYDGVAAVAFAAAHGRRVLAVGQHDDRELRQRAIAAGAERVFPYRTLFERGPATLARWLDVEPPARAK